MPVNKNNYNMLREIEEQPAALKRLISAYIKRDRVEMPEFREFREKLMNIRRFSFWGIGSSYHAAIYGNYLFEELCALPGECESADELVARKNVLEPDTAVVVLSQSGETTDLIEAVKKAKMQKVLTIGIINNQNSTLASLVDVSLFVRAGEEKALATTKVFTGQLLVLNLLAMFYQQFKARYDPLLLAAIKKLPEQIKKAIDNKNTIIGWAKKYRETDQLTVLGRHWHYPIALETALKLKEVAYIKAEGMAAETFRHGPEAVVDNNFLAFMFLPANRHYEENMVILEEITRAGGRIMIAANQETEKVEDQIILPRSEMVLQPIISVTAGQYLAYYLALERGLDIDHPRNIFKFIKK